jgi:ABC-type transporter Mla subunit MlaD
MTDDDVRNTMQFILEQQAQLTATVGRLSEKVDRTADGITALLAIAEIHEREIETLKDSTADNGRDISALKDTIAANSEAGRATDERLNALINVVEQMISERRGGSDRPT